jgi:Ca-activated chloride channel family protein
MLTFTHPWLLLLLALVPALVWLRHFRRSAAVRFSDGEALAQLPASWAVRAQRVMPLLYALGLSLAVVALARPRQGLEESRVSAEVVDIVLVVDVSPSMDALDLAPDELTKRNLITRLDVAKTVLKKFIEARTSDRMSIVAFSQMPYTVCPLTIDQEFLLSQIDRLETGMLGDGTAIGTAIASGTNRLRESKAKSRIMVLLTDGSNNSGNLTPLNAAQAAKALGFKIYTVGVGKEGLVYIKQKDRFGNQGVGYMESDIDEETLQTIGKETGARFFRAQNLKELDTVYEEIDQMEKTEIKNEVFTRYNERFEWFAAAAAGLLILEALLSATRLGRVI